MNDSLLYPTKLIIQVAIAVPLRRVFDYYCDEKLAFELYPGMRVKVPFGNTFKIGIIESVTTSNGQSSTAEITNKETTDSETPQNIAFDKLKPIHTFVDKKPLADKTMLELYGWMKNYYHAPPGEIWQTILPSALMKGAETQVSRVSHWRITQAGIDALGNNQLKSNAIKQRQALLTLQQSKSGLAHDQIKQFAIQSSTLKTLAGKKWVEQSFELDVDASSDSPIIESNKIKLNPAQQQAVDQVKSTLDSFHAFLLFGVTASGKTEVYLQVIEEVINRGKQALVLVPEIGLTPQTLNRFQNRFNVEVITLHSGMTDQQRLQAWLKARSGQARCGRLP